ncbi:aldose 1-epimerase [Homoserinimonas aerilata]|uniref:Aldose 1-epimerase n=1 Tax=Homoserinimonas aerilata TaxID=1162970 RepID=A0A542YG03_9MICO|nr:aldose 1-epimerase family protein [Homoserinimonas aerilata]TQL47012.1 aldose 1-epimerase [Homoserinimonas aerilata]
MRAPTGEQHVLSRASGSHQTRAIITEVAASLRELVIDGTAVTQPYPESSRPPFGDGIVLVPWPNRVEDGRWLLDGEVQQLDVTEPDRNSAIHGLLRNAPYTVAERSDDAVTLAATVFPQHGYPFLLDTTVRYELLADGLRVTHTVTNHSDAAAPVALGVHPFFRIGEVPTDDLVLTLSASSRFETDARLNPVGELATAGTRFDLSEGVPVRELQLDDAFGGLTPDADGTFSCSLTATDGRSLRVWQESDWRWVQVFTTREFPTDGGPATAIAIEPMTAPPNAFNSGLGVRWLQPGESWSTSWGVTLSGGAA